MGVIGAEITEMLSAPVDAGLTDGVRMPKENRSEWCWRKSSSSGTGNCVEVAFADDRVHIRDSKDPEGPVISVAPEAWEEFMGQISAGGFRID